MYIQYGRVHGLLQSAVRTVRTIISNSLHKRPHLAWHIFGEIQTEEKNEKNNGSVCLSEWMTCLK
jgi:hypothetical protein